jgi:hypothetical protein
MPFLDELKEWTQADLAAAALGRALGVFDASVTLTDVKAVLWTNNAAGNTLYGMLERLARLGVLEHDEAEQRYRAARPNLHPLTEVDHVPALAAGPPARASLHLAVEPPESFRLEADRAGFRYLARVFDEIADSGLDDGWQFERDGRFRPNPDGAAFTFKLVDPTVDDADDARGPRRG